MWNFICLDMRQIGLGECVIFFSLISADRCWNSVTVWYDAVAFRWLRTTSLWITGLCPPSPLHQLKPLTGIYLVTAILFQWEIIRSPLNDNSLATSVYNWRHMTFDRLLGDPSKSCVQALPRGIDAVSSVHSLCSQFTAFVHACPKRSHRTVLLLENTQKKNIKYIWPNVRLHLFTSQQIREKPCS